MKTSAVVFEKSGTGKTVVASKLHEGYMRQGERTQYIAIHERQLRGDYMSENEIMLSGGTDLMTQSGLYEPMSYYGVLPRISIKYISDVHLLHHAQFFDDDIHKTVRVLARSLYDSSGWQRSLSWNTPIFLGDISSNADLTVAFYRQYRLNAMYEQYRQFRREQVSAEDILAFENKRVDIKRKSDNLARYIAKESAKFEQIKSEIDKHVSYSKVIAPKGSLENIERYLESDYYKRRKLPYPLKKKILTAAALKDMISKLEFRKQKLDSWLVTQETPSEIKMSDFEYYPDGPIGLVVLGNHEYIGFFNVDEAVEFYKAALEPLGYIVLQNEYVENDDVVIYGGSGFAKYSERYNANNLVCCKAMEGNRAYEIEQTTLFENGYKAAKRHAIETGKCFICAAHYPVESCLGKFDREAVYFTGHTHINLRVRTEEKTLYADNQVGYHNKSKFDGLIHFKTATMDSVTNPYDTFEDGCYPTTPDEYLRFYEYIGEYVGEGKLIRKRCETGKLYVIKSQGYYGFFIVNKSAISIVNGGMTKKISSNTNINWIYDNFNIVVNKYLAVLEPLRMVQEQISRELKRLGFRGTIHGLIVDIDDYDHIMVNPVNGSITFYYSPWFGLVKEFESFQKQLEFMNDTGLLESSLFWGKIDLKSLEDGSAASKCDALALRGSSVLASVENNGVSDGMMAVSRTDGAYGISRAVSPLQRLFTGHVLRDFDLRLVEVEDENTTTRRMWSMCGRVYRDKNFEEFLIINDDLGEFVTLLDKYGKKSVESVMKLRTSTQGRSLNKGKWMTLSLSETIAEYKGQCLPKSWCEAIQRMQPKELETKE